MKTCSSCGREVAAATEFNCPSCGKMHVVRCQSCKQGKNPYVCGDCGFKGP